MAQNSDPYEDARTDVLLRRLQQDLKGLGKWEALRADFEELRWMNERLAARYPGLQSWLPAELRRILSQCGFKRPMPSRERIYGGQGMIVCATK